jgi:hypothetical protein
MARLSLALRYAGLALLAFALTNHVAELRADPPGPSSPSGDCDLNVQARVCAKFTCTTSCTLPECTCNAG